MRGVAHGAAELSNATITWCRNAACGSATLGAITATAVVDVEMTGAFSSQARITATPAAATVEIEDLGNRTNGTVFTLAITGSAGPLFRGSAVAAYRPTEICGYKCGTADLDLR